MRIAIALVVAATLLPTTLFAKCPAGKITCAQWCGTYGTARRDCMTGHPNSCDQKPKGAATCVGDHP